MAKGWLIGGGAFLGVLLIAAIVVALMQQEEDLPEGTPEATVQNFLRAIEAKEYQVAYDFLAQDLQNQCEIEDFISSRSPFDDRFRDERITLEDTNIINDSAVVTVRISNFDRSGPFGTSESSYPQLYTLEKENSEWRFTQFPSPFYPCSQFNRPIEPFPEATPTPTPEPTSTPEAASG